MEFCKVAAQTAALSPPVVRDIQNNKQRYSAEDNALVKAWLHQDILYLQIFFQLYHQECHRTYFQV